MKYYFNPNSKQLSFRASVNTIEVSKMVYNVLLQTLLNK